MSVGEVSAVGRRCDCCDLPVESCGKAVEDRARKEDANARSRALATPGWWQARWPGVCASCRSGFAEGDPITVAHNEGYISYCCLPA